MLKLTVWGIVGNNHVCQELPLVASGRINIFHDSFYRTPEMCDGTDSVDHIYLVLFEYAIEAVPLCKVTFRFDSERVVVVPIGEGILAS